MSLLLVISNHFLIFFLKQSNSVDLNHKRNLKNTEIKSSTTGNKIFFIDIKRVEIGKRKKFIKRDQKCCDSGKWNKLWVMIFFINLSEV